MPASKSAKKLLGSLLPGGMKRVLYRKMAGSYIADLDINIDPSKKTILALNHFFDQDLRALAYANRDYNLVVVSAPTLFKGAKEYFSPDVQDLRVEYSSEANENLEAYHQECIWILKELQKRFQINLILTVNDNFYWVREFIDVAHKRGIATVLIDKEGIITPHSFDAESERSKMFAPPISDHVFVWSDRQRKFWNRIGVPDDGISVIGQPRSDLFYLEKRRDVSSMFNSKQPLITLFSYHDDTYIPIVMLADEDLKWQPMKKETHDIFASLARKYPSFNFIIKTHPQQPDFDELQAAYHSENLKVVGGSAISNELILSSELIIAFQTTAVIEAMFLGKRIIYTSWSDLCERLKPHFLPFHEAPGIVVADSITKFQKTFENFLDGNKSAFDFTSEEISRRMKFIGKYLYKPDGHVSERFFEAVGKFIL